MIPGTPMALTPLGRRPAVVLYCSVWSALWAVSYLWLCTIWMEPQSFQGGLKSRTHARYTCSWERLSRFTCSMKNGMYSDFCDAQHYSTVKRGTPNMRQCLKYQEMQNIAKTLNNTGPDSPQHWTACYELAFGVQSCG